MHRLRAWATGAVFRRHVGVDVGDDDAGRRIDPFARVVDTRDGAGGTDDRIGCDRNLVDALDDTLEGEAEIEAAFREKAGGVGVTIYR
ncbi:MAG TPA: hypothetical protein VJN21_12435 [Candidatus Acidoferrales bacterium]|nr:hypothetical protein [Candidatus Acidoferrales bacterium]